MKIIYTLLLLSIACLYGGEVQGQLSITSVPANYANNFNNYNPTSSANLTTTANSSGTGTGFASTISNGWTASSATTAAYNGQGTGTSNVGGNWGYGSAADFSLGALRSTATGNITYTVSFTNSSAATITSLTLSWDYKQFRFANASGWDCTGTGQLASNTTLNAQDFAGSATVTMGVPVTTSVSSFTLSGLSVTPGQSFGINWVTTSASGADNGISIDNFSVAAAGVYPPPVLTPAIGATVDAPFNITFPDDAAWRGAITGIKVNGTFLSTSAYSTITPGQITFNPSLDPLLQSQGNKNIIIIANGYSNGLVSQTIASGAPAALTITQQPAAPAASGGTLATQPKVTAVDKYGNNSVGYAITAAVTVGQTSSWTLGGTNSVTTNGSGVAVFAGLTATNLTAAPYPATITFSYGGVSITSSPSFTIPAVAPTLAAAPSATVDNPFAVTFTDNASWRAAISSIKVGATTLTSGTDYTISAGQITFIPTASNPFHTPGSYIITVYAVNYSNATVSQTITAGAPYTLTVTTQPTGPYTYNGVLTTQPVVKAVDKYNNPVTGTYTITAAVASGQGSSWTLGGTVNIATSGGLATYTNLTATNLTANVFTANITFSYGSVSVTSGTFTIPGPPPPNDDCSNAITLTPAASPMLVAGTLVSSTPSSVILGYAPSKNDMWYKFTVPCTGSYTININYTTGTNIDIDFEAFAGGCPSAGALGDPFGRNHAVGVNLETKTANLVTGTVYYVRVIDYGSVSAGAFNISVVINPPNQPSVISGGSVTPCLGNTETYTVTPIAGVIYTWSLPGADWSGSSTTNTISVVAGSTAGNITVTPRNTCGLTGTAQTLAVAPVTAPLNVSGVSVSPGNGKLTITWSNPADCFDEIMVVATDGPNVTLVPSGDGTQYLDTTEYASATKNNALNMNIGEYCMYKGTSSAIIITGLLNSNPYKIKIYTRWGTMWSSGVQVGATPVVATTGAFKSIKSGLWTDNTTWNKLDNSNNWVPTTDFPNYYASDVTIETGNVVQINATPMAVANLEIKPGAQLWANDAVNNRYVSVYGNLTCDGIIGNANPNTADNIGINAEGGSTLISGTGTLGCARLRKTFTAADPGGKNTTNLYISMNINLFWNANTLYNNTQQFGVNTLFNVTVNYPNKVTLKNPTGNVAIDGTNGSGIFSAGGKFTVNGTLNIPGVLYFTTNNNSPEPKCELEIGSTGVVNVAIVNAPSSGTSSHVLTVKSGGLLNIYDPAGFAQFAPVYNYVNLNTGSTVQYSALGNQQVLSGQTYSNLIISGSGEKAISNQFSNITVSDNLNINAGTFYLNGKILALNGTVSGAGTITGSAASTINIGPNAKITSTPLGVLKFTPGRDSLNALTLDRMMKADTYPNHKYWAAVLGSNLKVAALTLNQGIIATDKYLLTLLTYPANAYNMLNSASYIATTDTLATAFAVGNTFNGSYGFRINGVKSNADTYFPIGADFITPNRAMVNLGNGVTRDMTAVLTKGDIIHTGSPRVNRIWYMYSSVADSINANMRLYYTGYDLATYPYLTKQDELETGFTGLRVRLVEKTSTSDTYFTNISNGSDTMVNFSPGTEVYAKYTKSVSTIYNGTKPGIYKFSVFSIVDGDNVVLPVTFTAVRAYQRGAGISVNWSVASEVDIDHYEVERAGNGRLFSAIASQKAQSSSAGGNTYAATDEQPLAGANYYRIKAVGKNGQVFYSTVVNVTLGSDGKTALVVYPNPIKNNQCTIQLTNLAAGKYNITVYSMTGQRIALKQIEHAGGSISQKLYLPAGTAAGVYIVKLKGTSISMQTSVFVSGK